MYYYIYDSFTCDPRYSQKIGKISLKLAHLDILGKEARVTPIKKIKDLVDEAIKQNYKNIIAVGDDNTVLSLIQNLADQAWNGCLGLIPLKKSIIAEALGIPLGEKACEVISARRVEKVDLGKINHQYFLTLVKIGQTEIIQPKTTFSFLNLRYIFQEEWPEIKIKFKEGFAVSGKFLMLFILNILKRGKLVLNTQKQKIRLTVNPKDGLLDCVMVGAQSKLGLLKNIGRLREGDFENITNLSFFRTKKIEISSRNFLSCLADGQPLKALPQVIEVVPKRLNVIVGRERKF